jgi:c(7)-type cytochrome triheme protein
MFRLMSGLIVFGFVLTLAPAYAATKQGDIIFSPKTTDPVVFSHDYHTKNRGITCAACHFRTFQGDEAGFHMKRDKLNKREFCGHCHNGMKSFDLQSEKNCARCHKK